jgi:hypothetical protein
MQGAHALIAMRRNEPHWLLTDADATTYGRAIANAMRHVPIGVSQKALDFSALAFCVVNFESPRIYASTRARRQRRSSAEQPAPTATVYPFPSAAPQAPPHPSAAAAPNGGGTVEGFTGDGVDAPIGGH